MASMRIEKESWPNVTVLRKPDGGEVYLLGTCHVSSSSASQAEALVDAVRPSAVVLELCEGRRSMLRERADESRARRNAASSDASSSSPYTYGDVASKLGDVLRDWTSLIELQYSACGQLEAPSTGGEFRAAVRAATRVGANVVLGDRPYEVTAERLKYLVPNRELITMLLFGDSDWEAKQKLQQQDAAVALQETTRELSAALEQTPSASREETLRRLSARLATQADDGLNGAAAGFADAVLHTMLTRFWCKEIIREEDKARLRQALDSLSRIDESDSGSLTPTARRILLDERNVVLADSLKRQPGPAVVGVVGKGHVAGIAEVWDQDLAARLPEAMERAGPDMRVAAALPFGLVGVGVGAYRYRPVRYVLGATALAFGAGTARLVFQLRDRLEFFRRTQAELAEAASKQ